MSLSLPPDASIDPSLLYRKAVTAPLCPFNVVSQVPLSESQILILPSAYPLATCNQNELHYLTHQPVDKIVDKKFLNHI